MEQLSGKFPEMEHLYYIEVEVEKPIRGGSLPEGRYMTIPITGGRFEGEKLRGTVLPVGADWNTLKSAKSHVCTRYLLKTDDGALISLFTDGFMRMTLKGGFGMAAGKPEPSQYYFRQHLQFQTGAAGYTWLNDRTAFAVVGMTKDMRICYDAYILKQTL